MASIRQSKIESVIQSEVSVYLQRNSSICLGTMVSVTVVRVTSDLSLARCYLSIFGAKDKQEVFENIEANVSRIRGEVGKKLKNLRKIPALKFHIDDSLDYASKIDELLKK
ncbi:MAG: 30S ribosome-binding factor RbfA [Crocinitomicaceae bacterium]|jgi:ribosome-binding factor A|nr:30S ribosome-binding factor RbfA [Crocinitomicaceae bacterium]MDG1736239.1 30S ribosome-binding factor RbfA [Crocinitomicaceae bacterium]MDG2504846.1 30S ribosome-binding factor RbfA [Crocinitomicaceae bacterium]